MPCVKTDNVKKEKKHDRKNSLFVQTVSGLTADWLQVSSGCDSHGCDSVYFTQWKRVFMSDAAGAHLPLSTCTKYTTWMGTSTCACGW